METIGFGGVRDFKEVRIVENNGNEKVLKKAIVFEIKPDDEGVENSVSIVNVEGIERLIWLMVIKENAKMMLDNMLGD